MHKALTFLALISCSTAALAQDDGYSKLTGNMTITSKDYSDPPAGQMKDRVGFVLIGPNAKRMYDAMKVKATKDACEEGMRTKTAGPLDCTRSRDGSYTCMFAIMLTNGQSRPFGEC